MQSQYRATVAWSNSCRHLNRAGFAAWYHGKEEAHMKYINANALLPPALVRELQTYIQGGYLYIPADPAHPKPWGEVSGYRQELAQRNRQIKEEYQSGTSMEYLSEKYCLSLYAVRKIIYQK